ncbi:MAG: guanylate kinase, partial [Candidatus Binataceae bacterium]
GIIFILSAPSGAGKTTISRAALQQIDGLEASTSLTTRPPREGERDGVDYHFVSEDEFQRRATVGDFAERARVFDSGYGTLREPLDRAVAAGGDILLDIDVQGAAQIRQRYPRDAVTIFVLPPSFAELEERLRRRGTESLAAIAHRLQRAHAEASAYPDYDYLLINVEVAGSIAQLRAIVDAERLKVTRLAEGFSPWKV